MSAVTQRYVYQKNSAMVAVSGIIKKKKSVVFAVFRSVRLKIAQRESDQRAAEREE